MELRAPDLDSKSLYLLYPSPFLTYFRNNSNKNLTANWMKYIDIVTQKYNFVGRDEVILKVEREDGHFRNTKVIPIPYICFSGREPRKYEWHL